MEACLKVMGFGANYGVKFAVDRMSRSKGGLGGRIITTASAGGLVVSEYAVCSVVFSSVFHDVGYNDANIN
jgi:NAD(P)-dependent dehydrogenase (short-subunit alcohol dehydrogenase family)